MTNEVGIPRDKVNDYSDEWSSKRRDFVKAKTGTDLEHVGASLNEHP